MSLPPKDIAIGFVVGSIVFVTVGAIGWSMREKPPPTPVAEPKPQTEPEPEPTPTPTPPPSKPLTFEKAVQRFRGEMGDTFGGFAGTGTDLLLLWATRNMQWGDVSGSKATTLPKVLKNAPKERGKSLCVRGTVIEIYAKEDKLGNFARTYHWGTMAAGQDLVRFYAVGSTGDIVRDTIATLCGVATGIVS